MTTKHTPESDITSPPWVVEEDARNCCFRIVSPQPPYRFLVATTGGISAADRKCANLIVAAPETAAERDRLKAINAELLSALEGLLLPHEQGWKVTDWDLRRDQARAAIAKAKGEVHG